jgi:hypothetical protein
MTCVVRDFSYASVTQDAGGSVVLNPAKRIELSSPDALEKIEHSVSSVFSRDWEFGAELLPNFCSEQEFPESPKMHCIRGRSLPDSSNGLGIRKATKKELAIAANSVNPNRSVKKICEEYIEKGIRINPKTLRHRVKRLGLVKATKDQLKAAKKEALFHKNAGGVCENYAKKGIFVCYETLNNYVKRSGLAKATKAQLKAAKKEAASDKDIMKVCENYKKKGVLIDPRPLRDCVRRDLDNATEDQLKAAKQEALSHKDLVEVCNKYAERRIYIPLKALEFHVKSMEKKNCSAVPPADLSAAIEEAVAEAADFSI